MGLVNEVMLELDNAVQAIATSDSFLSMADPLSNIIRLLAVIAVAMLGINMMFQFHPMMITKALGLVFRITLVAIFSQPDNFFPVYDALTNAPAELANRLTIDFGGAPITDGYDLSFSRAVEVGNIITENGGWVAGAIMGGIMFIFAAAQAAIAMLVLGAAKIMIAILALLAPLFLAFTLNKSTAPMFESWLKSAITVALIPLIATAVSLVLLGLVGAITSSLVIANAQTFGDILAIIVLSMVGSGLMLAVPSMASQLVGSGFSIAGIAAGAADKNNRQLKDMLRRAAPGGNKQRQSRSPEPVSANSARINRQASRSARRG